MKNKIFCYPDGRTLEQFQDGVNEFLYKYNDGIISVTQLTERRYDKEYLIISIIYREYC